MFKTVDDSGVGQQALVGLLTRYKRERAHLYSLFNKKLLTELEFQDKLNTMDLSIATVRVLLNRGAKAPKEG